jgi:hypothetical protein
MIDLPGGEIKLWLYLSEPLCQQVSAELAKTRNPAAAFRLIKPLVHRATEVVRLTITERHLPPHLRVISDVPNLDARVPPWLTQAGRRLATKIDEWATRQLIGYLRENADEFRRICADRQDGVTLRVTISRIPGIDTLRAAARGQLSGQHQGWSFTGTPAVVIHAQPGHVIR